MESSSSSAPPPPPPAEYDFAVIGGGSGGMAAAKEAKACGARKVVCFDYVKPTVHGTRWGLGGTCVNVGCIPKKLMHYAAQMGPVLHSDAAHYGWQFSAPPTHDWTTLVDTVQTYIKQLNFSYRVGLRAKNVEYINALASLEDANTIVFQRKGQTERIKAKHILIAVGGRPFVPKEDEVPGAHELAITSDDLFSLPRAPGKTLVVGASYIALECAGFLTELGYDCTVAVRSIVLRGFDRQCAEKIADMMKQTGTKFINTLPVSLERVATKQLRVTFADGKSECYDTVMYAAGRQADTQGLGLAKLGVKMTALGKLICENEQSKEVPSIFAVGDCLHGVPELTPVAIRAGELLARRLFGGSTAAMDYSLVPTAVFTPMEYGTVGLNEETAAEKYGADNVETFLYEFPTLELAAAHRPKVPAVRQHEADVEMSPNTLCKLVCLRNEDLRVVGFHFVGLNAGEVCQGYALALRCNARKRDFDDTIGIHPTDAEAFHSLTVTRRSGDNWVATGGCGGGKCG